jgi:hypothetical protein
VSEGRRGGRQRRRQGLDDPASHVVLELEQVAHRRRDGVRSQDRAARRLDELRRHAELIARPQQRAHHHAVHIRLCRQRLEVRRLGSEACGDGTRPQHERPGGAERRRDGVGEAEREEVGFWIRTQHAERQHHQARQRVRQARGVVTVGAGDRAQLFGHHGGRRRPIRGTLRQGAPDHAVHRRDRRRPGERRRLLEPGRVQNLDDRAADERRPACEHLEQDRAGGEEVAARVHGLAADLLRRHVPRRPDDHAVPGHLCHRDGVERLLQLGRARPKSSSFTPWAVRTRSMA